MITGPFKWKIPSTRQKNAKYLPVEWLFLRLRKFGHRHASFTEQLQKSTKRSAAWWSFPQIQGTVMLFCMHSKFMNATMYFNSKGFQGLIMVSWEKRLDRLSDPIGEWEETHSQNYFLFVQHLCHFLITKKFTLFLVYYERMLIQLVDSRVLQ